MLAKKKRGVKPLCCLTGESLSVFILTLIHGSECVTQAAKLLLICSQLVGRVHGAHQGISRPMAFVIQLDA